MSGTRVPSALGHINRGVLGAQQLTAFDTHTAPARTPRPRRGRPRVKGTGITSVLLTTEERRLLERVADAEGVSFADVWRRALRAYAADHELLDDDREVPAAV